MILISFFVQYKKKSNTKYSVDGCNHMASRGRSGGKMTAIPHYCRSSHNNTQIKQPHICGTKTTGTRQI